MTEFFTVKRIDNSRLVRPVARGQWREFARLVALGSLLAGLVLIYAWEHFECLAARYDIEELKAARAEAGELNQELKLEAASLRAPMRIDAIAKGQLGLTVPVPGQVTSVAGPAGAMLAEAARVSSTTAQ